MSTKQNPPTTTDQKSFSLQTLLDEQGWTVEEAAEAMGDSPLRLYKVLEGAEELGRTATLAALALKHNLEAL